MDSENSPLESWLELQQSYLETLRQNTSASFEGDLDASAFEPSEATKMFRATMEQGVPDELYASLTSLHHHANHFAEFAQSLTDAMSAPQSKDSTQAVLNAFTDYVQQHTVDAVLSHWQLPQQLAPLLEFTKLQQTAFQDHPLFKGMDISSHGSQLFGSKNIHEQLNTSTQLITEYETALADYIEQHKTITSEALKGLESRLASRNDGIESLSELHDVWVESYESSYSHAILSQSYQSTHGAMNNAVMGLQKHLNSLRDEQLNTFGVATRKDMDLAFERQFKLRKEVRQLRQLVGEVDYLMHDQPQESLVDLVVNLQEEVKALRKDISELKQKAGDQ